MTTARNSLRNRVLACAAGLTVCAVATAYAHRRDEYLQSARIAIDPSRVGIQLDLTPGAALARTVVNGIDRDGDRAIGDSEAQSYSARVLSEVRIELDGKPLQMELAHHRFPAIAAMLRGQGTIRLELEVAVPSLSAGPHQLLYRNGHRNDIGVYLANALVPASERVLVLNQKRDVNQRELVIEYTLREDAKTSVQEEPSRRNETTTPVTTTTAMAAIAAMGGILWWWSRKR